MDDIKLILNLSASMLLLAKDSFDRHGCNDLDDDISKLIPIEWCEEARNLNSNGKDPWPGKPDQFGDSGLMWFLAEKLQEMSIKLDRDSKINNILK